MNEPLSHYFTIQYTTYLQFLVSHTRRKGRNSHTSSNVRGQHEGVNTMMTWGAMVAVVATWGAAAATWGAMAAVTGGVGNSSDLRWRQCWGQGEGVNMMAIGVARGGDGNHNGGLEMTAVTSDPRQQWQHEGQWWWWWQWWQLEMAATVTWGAMAVVTWGAMVAVTWDVSSGDLRWQWYWGQCEGVNIMVMRATWGGDGDHNGGGTWDSGSGIQHEMVMVTWGAMAVATQGGDDSGDADGSNLRWWQWQQLMMLVAETWLGDGNGVCCAVCVIKSLAVHTQV